MWWYRKAADQGCPEAQLRVSRKYRHGEGIKKNLVEAYKWSLISEKRTGWNKWMISERENSPTRKLSKQMTVKQRAEAKRLAAVWKPSPLLLFKLNRGVKESE